MYLFGQALDLVDELWSMGLQLLFIVAIYIIPIIIASMRDIEKKKKLTIITIALGWTFFAWAACLVWSILGVKNKHRDNTCLGGGFLNK